MEIFVDSTQQTRGLPSRYSKGKFLGKGGFAKCYEVTDTETNEVFAAKIVEKSLIQKPKVQAKLKSEISIHRSLEHDKIVHFYDYYEDSECVYMILELCPNQTLNDLMRKRPNKRLSEQESMFYIHDLITGIKYLQGRRVIHRDLKLGNLFLDSDARLKVGDFGLAAQLEHDGEKKRTVCGTPNYIAPEVLEGKSHSYGVDVWSLGVILYTMLVGRPPFETNDVKSTYKRIRCNQFSFPDTVALSSASKALIRDILQTDPQNRPSLDSILVSPWFQQTRLPPSLPTSISGYAASPRPVNASARSETPERVDNNFARIDSPATRFPLRDRSTSATPISGRSPNCLLPQGPVLQAKSVPNSGGTTPGRCNVVGRPPLCHRGNDENIVPSNGTESPTGKKGSLGSWTPCDGFARGGQQAHSYTPVQTAESGMPRVNTQSHRAPSAITSRESSPIDAAMNTVPAKLITSARSAMSSPRQALHSSGRYDTTGQGGANSENTTTPKKNRSQQTFGQPISSISPCLLSRKSNVAPGGSPRQTGPQVQHGASGSWFDCKTPGSVISQAKNEKRQSHLSARKEERNGSEPALLADWDQKARSNQMTGSVDGISTYRKAPESGIRGLPSSRSSQSINSPAEMNFGANSIGSEPLSSRCSSNALPEMWVTKWVDYSSKYGVGYMLSDACIGVYFNDSTKIIMSQQGDRFDYLTRRTQEKPEVRTTYTMDEYPEDLRKKVTLLRHFTNYMLTDKFERRDGASGGESALPKTCQTSESTKTFEPGQSPYVKKWIRNRHAIMFQLSNKVIHVIFFDKTEAILSPKKHTVTYIDKKSNASSYPFSNNLDVPNAELARRLKYVTDILASLLGARAGDLGGA